MTKLLDKAFEAVAGLPEDQQDALAALILDEIASEDRWDRASESSRDVLDALADEALAEHRAGQSKPIDLDSKE